METEEVARAVEERRRWLRAQLDVAAARLSVTLVGEAVNTYDMRSAGAPARDGDRDVWLRVVVADPNYLPACRWDGNVLANSISGVPKPQVLRWTDWQNDQEYLNGRRLRSEVMTRAPGTTVAPGGVLHSDPHLPESWWAELDSALSALAAFPVQWDNELGAVRYAITGARDFLGVELRPDFFSDMLWTTAHADLHWGNLRAPVLCILDWETWRPAPAGYDVATLYCNSLLHPPTAQRLRATPVLATRSGQIALLSVIFRYLRVVGEGSDIDLLENQLRAEAITAMSHLDA